MNRRSVVFLGMAIFVVALAARLLVVFSCQVLPQSDGIYDNKIAVNLINGRGFGVEGASYSRPPGYPLFIAAIYSLFGENNFLAVRTAQSFLSALTCFLIYLIAARLMGRPTGVISGLIAAVYPVFIMSANIYRVESLSTFLFAAAVWRAVLIKDNPSFLNLAALGLILAFFALVWGMAVFYIVFLLSAMLYFGYFGRAGLKKAAASVLVIFLFFVMPFIPWTIRNYKVHRAFVPISTQAGYMLYLSYKPPEGKLFGFNTLDETVKYAKALDSQVETSKYLAAETLKFIKENPLKALKLEVLKFFFFWSPFDWEVLGINTDGRYNFMYAFIFPFFVFGAAALAGRFKEFFLLYLPLVYFQIMAFLFYGSPRFRVAVEPFIIIFGSWAIFKLYRKFSARAAYASLLSVWLCVNLAFYFYSGHVKAFARSIFEAVHLW